MDETTATPENSFRLRLIVFFAAATLVIAAVMIFFLYAIYQEHSITFVALAVITLLIFFSFAIISLLLLRRLVIMPTSAKLRDAVTEKDEAIKEKEMLALAQEELAEQNLRVNLLLSGMGVALWDMILPTDREHFEGENEFWWSDEFRHMLGFTDESDFPNIHASWSDRLHPEDKQEVFDAVSAHMYDKSGQTPYDMEYRLMLKNGEYRYFHAFGESLRDDEGNPLRIAGAIEDIDEMKRIQQALKYREEALNALNEMAVTFFSHENEGAGEVMNKGIRPVASVLGIDTIAIYRQSSADGQLGQVYLWQGATRELAKDLVKLPPIPPVLRWLEELKKGHCVNADIRTLPEDAANFLENFNTKAIFMVPIFMSDELWGIITLEDHKQFRSFTADDADFLRSAAYLCAGVIVRNEIEREATATHEFNLAILNTAPVSVIVIDDRFKVVDCNDSALRMFKCDKQFYLDHFYEKLSPPSQPDGTDSIEQGMALIKRALAGEKLVFEWTHQTAAGDLFPTEITLSRVRRENRYFLLGYQYDLTNQNKMLEDLRAQDEKLKEALEQSLAATRAKSDFLSNMSHEMRTPMNAIIGMTAIARKAESLEEKNHALNKIGDASSHLLGVINDVLDMAKIEADKLELASVDFNFEHMLQRVITVINFRVEEKKLRFTMEVDEKIPRFLVGDDQRLAQVITNLLSNAVKFTPEGGEIRLDATFVAETDGYCELQIKVADSGIGISAEQQTRLFSAFVQADSGTSREYGGTGLGLVICKRIVDLMHGRIWIESELGKGAAFIFTIKARRGQATPDSEADDASAQLQDGELKGKTMLLAEDVEINREIIVALLEDTGIAIDCAENGQEALDMVAAHPDKYDVVFMDVQMPQMDGLEATRHIRTLPPRERGHLPIIAMTANVFKSDIDECKAAGMDGHIGKPLDIEKVLEVLKKYCS
jgi:PAS domain S-box-containing protein